MPRFRLGCNLGGNGNLHRVRSQLSHLGEFDLAAHALGLGQGGKIV